MFYLSKVCVKYQSTKNSQQTPLFISLSLIHTREHTHNSDIVDNSTATAVLTTNVWWVRASSHVKIIHIESNTCIFILYIWFVWVYEHVCIRTYTFLSETILHTQKNTQQNEITIQFYSLLFLSRQLNVFDNYFGHFIAET